MQAVDFDPFAGPEIIRVVPSIEPQQEIWISCLIGGDDANRSYNESVSLRMKGVLRQSVLEDALRKLVLRHDALRSTFSTDGKQLCIYRDLPLRFRVQDLSSDNAQDIHIRNFLKENALEVFDLVNGPLFRADLLILGSGEFLLTISAHHIICDGWSLGILLQDLGKFYSAGNGSSAPFDAAPSFGDYAVEQRKFTESTAYKQIEDYWITKYLESVPEMAMPADFPRPDERMYKSHRADFPMRPELVAAVKKIGAESGCTLVTTFMAAYEIFLHRITAQEDIVLGIPAAGQPVAGLPGLVGHCVNLLPVRSHSRGTLSFRAYLMERKKQMLNDYDHQQITFGRLLKKLNIPRDASRIPLVPLAFNIDIGLDEGVLFEGLEHRLFYNAREFENFEIFLNIGGSEKALQFEWSYNTGLFEPATIAAWMQAFVSMLEGIVANPSTAIRSLPLYAPEAARNSLKNWNATTLIYPKEKPLHELIRETSEKFPDQTAIRFGNRRLTYQQVNENSNQLAACLLSKKMKAGDVVGVAMSRTPEMILVLLAILKSGAAYLPLDPLFPKERIDWMLADAEAVLLITSKAFAGVFAAAQELVAEEFFTASESCSRKDIATTGDSSELAYVLYTSGSGGRPKGVQVEHRNFVNLLCSMQHFPGIHPRDKLLAVTTISFDIAGLELFLPLLTGAELVLAPEDVQRDGRALLTMLREEAITLMQATPVTYKLMLAAGWDEATDLKILCCGEPLTRDLAEQLIPRCRALFNMYGPTETTIYSTGAQIISPEDITIGRPIGNTQIYIADEYGNLLPGNLTGEIYIGGAGVSRGYLNRPELNSEKFIPDLFSGQAGSRLYRTGDLGKFSEDGRVVFLGRNDQQIKVRGYRIEPGEIEFALQAMPEVQQSVVVSRADKSGIQRLVAYVIAAPDVVPESLPALLKIRLVQSLPAFMVPADFVFISEFPVTMAGKLDRRLLPAPVNERKNKPAELSGTTDRKIAAVWSEFLGVSAIEPTDDFFALGGHSLIAALLMRRLETETGLSLPLTTVFKYPVLEAFIAFFKKQSGEENLPDEPAGPTLPEPEILTVPAIEPQMEIWVSCILGGEDANRSYNISMSEKLSGMLEFAAMENAMQELINRHESLRSVFSADGTEIFIRRDQKLQLQFEDLSGMQAVLQEKFIENFSRKNAETAFDLLQGPLHRFALFDLGNNTCYLTFTAHHAICDGWSFGVLMQELGKLYSAFAAGKQPKLQPAPRFSLYANEQQAFYESETYQQIQQYWLDQLRDGAPVLEIPTDFPRPATRTYKSHRDDYFLDPELISKIKKIGSAAGCSLAITLRTLFEMLLYRVTDQRDIVLGLPAAGQLANGNYFLTGHCVNLLPVRSRLERNISFVDYLTERKTFILDAYDHQRLTFGSLLQKLNVARDKSRVPLVPVTFNVEMGLDDGVGFLGLHHEMTFNSREFETFEISVNAGGSEEHPVMQWSYNTQLFKSSSIRRLMDTYQSLLREVILNPAIPVMDIPLPGLNMATPEDVRSAYPGDLSIAALFSEQARMTPLRKAVSFGLDTLTYRTLDERSNQLAHYLRSRGVTTDTLVPICMERSVDLIVAILGILKAGAAYVPLDPEYPLERLQFMLEDTQAGLLLCNRKSLQRITDLQNQLIVLIDEEWKYIGQEPVTAPPLQASGSSLAYVMYTSGSTGRPKGVMIENHHVVSLVRGVQYVNLTDKNILLSTGSVSFDATSFEYWAMLLNGGELVLCSDEALLNSTVLKQEIRKRKVNMMWFTASLLNQWVDLDIGVFEGLRTVLAGGEKLSESHIEKLRNRYPALEIVNGYGPTENTTFSLTYRITEMEITQPIPIGLPLTNRTAYVLNRQLNLCGVGMIGELYVGGAGVARGYLNRPDLTKEKFIRDPFSSTPGARMYRTGDLARRLADGNIEYHGRLDDQVKIRGYRIEPAEIESVIQQYPGIQTSVVVAREDDTSEKKLIAYVVPKGAFSKEDITEFLLARLPAYMVPRIFIPLNRIPLTGNGKLDKKALPDPDLLPEFGNRILREPESETQKMLARIWCDALRIQQLSIDDNFFELGGHSLIAVRVMKMVEERTSHRLPISALFEAPTIEKLSRLLDEEEKPDAWKSLVPIRQNGSKPPLYIVHGSGLTVLIFHDLAMDLDADQPVYGLQARGLNGTDEPFDNMEDIAAYYVAEIIKQNPTGPYNLAGYSFGGIVAFEMAKQLKSMGKEVNMLAIFDTYADNSGNFDDWVLRMGKKFKRQFPKFRFVLRSFRKHPGETLVYQFNYLKNKFVKLIARSGLVKAHEISEEHLEFADKINYKHDLAFEKYKLKPYDGTIDLFRVKSRMYYLDDPIYMGWKPYALQGLNIHEISGDHKTFLLPPNVEELARKIREILTERNAGRQVKNDFTNPSSVLKAIRS